jgi:hypothetical protein
MSVNPTFRCFIAAGPSHEVDWLIEQVRGPLVPRALKGIWKPRLAFSLQNLGALLPRHQRPLDIPDEAGARQSADVWESDHGMMRARWEVVDQWFLSEPALQCLFLGLSRRYPTVCWINAWEDPDLMEAGAELYVRGRFRRRTLSERKVRKIARLIYRRAGVPLDDAEELDDAAAASLVDDALLDLAELQWDLRVEQFLRHQAVSRRTQHETGSCGAIRMAE